MRIIGIDPGYAIVGFGVLDYRGVEFTTLEYGAILTEAHTDFPQRLGNIYEDMCFILERFKPDALAIEQLFFYSNKATGIDVAQARGVILLAAVQYLYLGGVAILLCEHLYDQRAQRRILPELPGRVAAADRHLAAQQVTQQLQLLQKHLLLRVHIAAHAEGGHPGM